MPKKSTNETVDPQVDTSYTGQIAQLKAENLNLRTTQQRFINLLRSTHDHYQGVEEGLQVTIDSLCRAREDCAKLLQMIDDKAAAEKAEAEKGVQGEGTG